MSNATMTETKEEVRMHRERQVYVTRLWSTELFLAFDGNLIHLENGTFNWKTGEKIEDAEIPEDKMNTLGKHDLMRVEHLIEMIGATYLEDCQYEEQA